MKRPILSPGGIPAPWVSSTPARHRRSGPAKAIIALARKLLIVAWRMLQTGEVYRSGKNDDGNPQAPRVANEEPDSDGVNAVS